MESGLMDLKQRKNNNNSVTIIPIDIPGLGDAVDGRNHKAWKRGRGKEGSSYCGGPYGVSRCTLFLSCLLCLLLGSGGSWVFFQHGFLQIYSAEMLKEQAVQFEKQQAERDAEWEVRMNTMQLANGGESYAGLEKRMHSLQKYKANVQTAIQAYFRQRLVDKYGPGPFFVEINLEIDPNSNIANKDNNAENQGRIVLELASAQEMPHSVFWFLEQVDAELFDGCSFYRNADHIIQAGPRPNFMSPPDAATTLAESFQQSGLAHLLFQEYSEKFPHLKHTVGFAGRPAGPEFFISVTDNTHILGPGGQWGDHMTTEGEIDADPCFGYIVEGWEFANRMHQSATTQSGDDNKLMQHNIAIKTIRQVSKSQSKPEANA